MQKLDSGEYVINNEDKANILNNFFCSITEIENSNVLTPDFHDRTGNRIDTLHITSDEVKDILECLQLGKAVGSDLISHCMLKNTASTICKPLQLIFNYSLQTRKFPKIWKSAIVIALFKKGIKSDPSNYRPISLLSCVGKVFERVVFKYIFNFLLDNSLIYKYQSGFMRRHSTVHQLIEMSKIQWVQQFPIYCVKQNMVSTLAFNIHCTCSTFLCLHAIVLSHKFGIAHY